MYIYIWIYTWRMNQQSHTHIYIVNATAHNSPTSSTLGFISFLQKAYVSGDLLRSQRWVQDVPNHRQMHVCSLKQSIGKVWLRNKSDPGISGFTWISQIVTAFTQGCSHVKALADGSWIYQATSIGPTIVGKSHTCSKNERDETRVARGRGGQKTA